MNNDKDKYTKLLDQIKALQPQLSDPQRLMSKTMDSVESLSKKKSGNKILKTISTASSIAASFLIGLFLFEMLFPPKTKEFTSSKIMPVYISPAFEKNVHIKNPMTLSDYSKILSIKTARRQEQRAFYSSLALRKKLRCDEK